MSALIEDSCIPLYTSAFNLLSDHTSHGLWKTSLGAPERATVEKADDYPYNYENNFDLMDPLEKSCKSSLTIETLSLNKYSESPISMPFRTVSLGRYQPLSPNCFPSAL